MPDEMSFGLYMRQHRNAKRWNLTRLAEETKLSYSHLSRLENDSSLPKPDTVVTLADALDGDLKEMLALAKCLPESILNQMTNVNEGGQVLRRAADRHRSAAGEKRQLSHAKALAKTLGLTSREADEAGNTVLEFLKLDGRQREALARLIDSMSSESSDDA